MRQQLAIIAAVGAIAAGAATAGFAQQGHENHAGHAGHEAQAGTTAATTAAAPAASGGSSRAERRAARKASLVPAGNPVDCVQLNRIRSTDVLDDQTIDFHMAGGEVLRNTLPMACPRLGFEERFSYRTSLNQLCSVDIITVLEQTGGIRTGASCGLGKFQPMKKAGA